MGWETYLTPTLGVGGLLAACVIAIITGRLIPKSSVDERLADKDRQIETWRSNYDKAMEALDEQRRQITALAEASHTTARVINAIPRAARMNGVTEGRTHELAAESDE